MTNDSQTPFAGSRILLAEDNAINREVTVALLNRFGFDVDTASNGLQAIEMVAGRSYDLVLMDIQMPGMDGLEATRVIRSMTDNTFNNENVPILALTASIFKEDIPSWVEAGMNDVIAKPVEPESLLSAIGKWLDKQQTPAVKDTPPSLVRRSGTASTDDELLCARLEKTEGIDTPAGLHNLQGDVAGYLSLLREFDRMLEDDMKKLGQLISCGEMDKARRLTHNFKGVTGTLGLVGLNSCTLALEAGLRDRIDSVGNHGDKTVEGLVETLKTQVKAFHDALRGSGDLDG
jgi:two-component system sensor histidine kinase/response regulator